MCSTLMWSLIRLSFALIKPGFKTYQKLKLRTLTREEMRKDLKFYAALGFFLYFDFMTWLLFNWLPLINMFKTVAFFVIFNDKNEVYLTLYDDLIHNILSKSENRIINRVNGIKSFAKDYAKEKALILVQILAKTTELVFKNLVAFAISQYQEYKEKNPSSYKDVEFVQKLTQWYDTWSNLSTSTRGNNQTSAHDEQHQKQSKTFKFTENKVKVNPASHESDSFVFNKEEIEVLAKATSSSSSPETLHKDYDIEFEPITTKQKPLHTLHSTQLKQQLTS
ncbi:hypothetical protein CONCODRAFT_12418 [Conidiobolus coronatus NRRL 28638]|uniref:Protein YOP1 n=1 Tax=Conidiobolus coronatus (strain ATCC 28846 / CBS 209.66 / NRRL 28638) TaxID=796925 RepID=A0A137NSX1_CONC2|nr:hypothetical protein CONCODRAFT_12418 [Conidiobolus coronatus NRRL 28638]|eukprot:KXN65877.1 hypothetical protein CONCODRAFT_12418 [Conidiobolus coronatus NRRL 28638]